MGGQTVEIPPEHRSIYHASAVMSCGALVALLRSAASLWQTMGIPETMALRALIPLARTTLENAASLGPDEATTGPVTRGDVSTVRQHLQSLGDAAPQVLPLYLELTKALVAAQHNLDEQKRRELNALLSDFTKVGELVDG